MVGPVVMARYSLAMACSLVIPLRWYAGSLSS